MNIPRRIEVLSIGDELLDGRVADTNTLRLAQRLQLLGLEIAERVSVRDDIAAILQAVESVCAHKTELCIVSGGLGPTADDLTAEAFARLLSADMVRDEEQAQRIRERLQRRGRPLTENQLKQADRPRGSQPLLNNEGTAPGFAVEYKGCRFVSVPGVPREFDAMLEHVVLSPLRAVCLPLRRCILRSFGLLEAEVDDRLKELPELAPGVDVGFRVVFPEIHISLTAAAEKEAEFAQAKAYALTQLGPYVFSESEQSFAAVLLDLLKARAHTLSLAESCTGGLIADLITDVPGASEVFVAGVVAYADIAKHNALGVKKQTLAKFGAVSEATVLEMAEGARRIYGTTWALAASGIAGPGGGSADKPVGTLWLGLAGPDVHTARSLHLPFDRRGNKVVTAFSALDLLRRQLF